MPSVTDRIQPVNHENSHDSKQGLKRDTKDHPIKERIPARPVHHEISLVPYGRLFIVVAIETRERDAYTQKCERYARRKTKAVSVQSCGGPERHERVGASKDIPKSWMTRRS